MSALRLDYKPLPVFYGFHTTNAEHAVAAGGYGSGKTIALMADAIELGLTQPGSEILICRRTIPSLRDTTEKEFVKHLPPEFFAACKVSRMGGHYDTIQFPNGSLYYFRGLDDWTKLKSLSIAGIYFDEMDEIDRETYEGVHSRLRQTKPTPEALAQGARRIDRRKVRGAFNPAGHNWIWQDFFGPDRKPGYMAFKSTSLDNPHLPVSYVESLLNMPEPWVRRYVLCDFDDFGGQIYQDFAYDTHVVPAYYARGRNGYDYDARGFFLMGMDPGTRDPTAAVWCYYDQDRHALVAVAQYQEHSLAARDHAQAWRTTEARHAMIGRVKRRIADAHAINVRDRGANRQLSDYYREFGYFFDLGPTREQERIWGLGQLITQRRFLVSAELTNGENSVFERIKDYQWKDLTPAQRARGEDAPDKPLKKNTHLVDACQFIATHHMAKPQVVVAPAADDREQHTREVHAAIRRQLQDARFATSGHDLGYMGL